jgi:hypothetical protein
MYFYIINKREKRRYLYSKREPAAESIYVI